MGNIQMKTFDFLWDSSVRRNLEKKETAELAASAKSVLIQLFTPEKDPAKIRTMLSVLREYFPTASIIGGSTPGVVAGNSLVSDYEGAVTIYFMESTEIVSYCVPCAAGEEERCGRELKARLMEQDDIKGLFLLGTAHTMDIGAFLKELKYPGGYTIFGGGIFTNDLIAPGVSIISDDKVLPSGVCAAAFKGGSFEARVNISRGWNAITKEYIIGETCGNTVKTISGMPAYELYRHYTGIEDPKYFARFSAERPFIINREGEIITRGGIIANEDGSVVMAGDINEGERFRIGYLMPENMISNSALIREQIDDCGAQAILIQSCVGRQSILEDKVDLECGGFDKIAPTSGFSSAGEIGGHIDDVQQQTNVMIVTELSEKPLKPLPLLGLQRYAEHTFLGSALNISSLTRLAYFFNAVASELEEANRRLDRLSSTDYLTGLKNRLAIEQALNSFMEQCASDGSPMSLVMLDIDRFKEVNDQYGHVCGDHVLKKVAEILRSNAPAESCGRWGGEEFLVALPYVDQIDALKIAERMRSECEKSLVDDDIHFTASFGVCSVRDEGSVDEVIEKVDKALYRAKRKGRNIVCK